MKRQSRIIELPRSPAFDVREAAAKMGETCWEGNAHNENVCLCH